MKIALISSGYIHQDPRYLFLADSLQAKGHEVVLLNVLSSQGLLPPPQHFKIFRKYSIQNIVSQNYGGLGWPFSRIYKFFQKEIIKFLDFSLSETGKTNRIKFFFYKMLQRIINLLFFVNIHFWKIIKYYSINQLYVLWYWPKFTENFLKSDKSSILKDVDLFYGLEPFFGSFIALELAKTTGKLLCIDFKELISQMPTLFSEEDKRLIKKKEQEFIQESALIPCVSQEIIDFYSQSYPHYTSKFVLLENSRPFDNLNPNFKREDKKIKFVVSAGSSGKDRGLAELLKIWERLDPQDAFLYIRIKDLPDKEKVQFNAIAQKTFGRSVFLTSPVSEDELASSLLEYDCGVIPYLPDMNLNYRYCCPNKFGQYLNAGLAVVSSNSETITERITKYNLGIVYDPYDTEGSLEKFRELIKDRKELTQKRQSAYNFAKTEYIWERSVGPFLSRLEELS